MLHLVEFGEFGKNLIEIGKRPRVREAMLEPAVKANGTRGPGETMQNHKLGKSNREVSAIGLGCMGMNWSYGPPENKQEMTASEPGYGMALSLSCDRRNRA